MADEIRVERDDAAARSGPYTADVTLVAPVAAGADAVVPDDPEAARSEIQQTRQRMSETIDEIEGVLSRKKEQIQDKLDVLAPVRENPLASVGIVFGAGLVLGLLTGGGDEDDDDGEDGDSEAMDAYWRERAEKWEARSRRLMRIAREQESELDELRQARASRTRHLWERVDEDADDAGDDAATGAGDFGETLASGLGGFFQSVLRQVTSGAR